MIRFRHILLTFSCLLLLTTTTIFSQEETEDATEEETADELLATQNATNPLYKQDAIVWLGYDFSYEIIDNLTLEFANQVRADNNWQSFKSSFIEASFNYKISGKINDTRKAKDANKIKYGLSFGGGYRYVFKDAYSQNGQRWYYVLSFKPYLQALQKKVSVSFRIKQQYDYVWNRTKDRHLIRGKMTVKFPFKTRIKSKLYDPDGKKIGGSFFVGNEMFYRFYYKGDYWYRYRLQLGLNFELPNWIIESPHNRSLTIKYIMQYPLNDTPEIDHIFAFLYAVEFDWDKLNFGDRKKKARQKYNDDWSFD